MMSRLVVNYNSNNAFAVSFIDLMRKSGVFSIEEEANTPEALAQKYYDGDEYERIESNHFLVGEPAPCACEDEEELLHRLAESEASGIADDAEVDQVFSLWNAK